MFLYIAAAAVALVAVFFLTRKRRPTPDRNCKSMSIEHGDGVPPGSLVAVTGASGFIGSHVIKELLNQGYKVRACVRNPNKATSVDHLKRLAEECKGHIEFASGDLLKKGSYDEAFRGVDGVIHCAAVVANKNSVKDPIRDIVDPSVQGSANIYDSVNKSRSVKRVVHTSSAAAIQTYDKKSGYVFKEDDWNTWSSYDNQDYYGVGKTMAELYAHRMAEEHQGEYDVAVINPGIAFGECMTKAHTKASPFFIRQLVYGNTQPDVAVPCVDVADVAKAHVQALKIAQAGGQRFVVVSNTTDFSSITKQLRSLFPAYRFTFKPYGGFFFNLVFNTPLVSEFERQVMLQKDFSYDNTKSQSILELEYTDLNDTLKTTIDTMTQWVKPKANKKK